MAFISPIPFREIITRAHHARALRKMPSFSSSPRAVLERTFVPVGIPKELSAPQPPPPPTTTTTKTKAKPPSTSSRPPTSPSIPVSAKPGVRDDTNFTNGSSVQFWRNLDLYSTKTSEATRNLILIHFQRLLQNMFSTTSNNPQDTLYFIYHFGRSLFFTLNGFLSILFAAVNGTVPPERVTKTISWGYFIVLLEAGYAFQQDLNHIKSGKYKMPWDVHMGLKHRQMSPIYTLQQTLGFFKESRAWFKKRQAKSMDIDVWLDGKIYPEYYKQTYHYQTDGWMSSFSANVYDFNTETLFVGRQDAMQRMTLLAFNNYFNKLGSKNRKIVEVGVGTGRFATFVRDNYPDVDYILSDLSPFYLQKAREMMRYWEEVQGNRQMNSMGSIKYLQAAAEDLPLPDASADVVFSIYLFHELPALARRAVIREAARVLKTGGLFVITDSIQLGDRPGNDPTLANFGEMNEPWYVSYIAEDFGGLVTENGKFVADIKEISSVSKTLSFRRTNM